MVIDHVNKKYLRYDDLRTQPNQENTFCVKLSHIISVRVRDVLGSHHIDGDHVNFSFRLALGRRGLGGDRSHHGSDQAVGQQ